MPTLGESFFADRYPEAVPQHYNHEWDFDWNGTAVEVKDCVRRTKGRFVIKPRNHERLVSAGGLYVFCLKRRLNSGREVITATRFVPANLIEIDEDRIRVETHVKHLNYTATKEVYQIKWKDIFESNQYWGWSLR